MKINDDVRKRYEELRPDIPKWEGDQHWANRLETWEDFVSNGLMVATLLRQLKLTSPDTWAEEIRGVYPELCDLVLEAF